jgi:hypothetical protein
MDLVILEALRVSPPAGHVLADHKATRTTRSARSSQYVPPNRQHVPAAGQHEPQDRHYEASDHQSPSPCLHAYTCLRTAST